jgi:ClpP class serine protease
MQHFGVDTMSQKKITMDKTSTGPSINTTSPSPAQEPTQQTIAIPKPPQITRKELVSAMFDGLTPDATDILSKVRDDKIRDYLKQSIENEDISKKYNILILYDEGAMVRSDADNIYSAVTEFSDKKPILFVLYSTGGSIASAYLIGKLCREYSHGELHIVVPRQAKSAATLICCAADYIHMGSLSELGPIDPQIDDLPALGLKNSVEHLADLVKKYPAASDMFAKYLSQSLKPIHLGYYERVAESATQYAERLLKSHASNLKRSPNQIAHDLVYTYKDHAFVIDKEEANNIFGDKIVHTGTKEYELGNIIYQQMSFFKGLASIMKYIFYFIGSPDTKPHFVKNSNMD